MIVDFVFVKMGSWIWHLGFGILEILCFVFLTMDLVFGIVNRECGVLAELVRPHLARDVS